MELKVFNTEGKELKSISVQDSIFGIKPNSHAIYLDVKQHLANKRQGTHKAKERSEVARTTKKFKRQKGTGTARAGSLRSPIFIGGGTIFGPRVRDYSFKLNKKLKRLARKSALSMKTSNNEIIVLDNIDLQQPKTKDFVTILKNLKVDNKKTLLVLSESNKNVYLSARNLQKTDVATVDSLSTYRILNANQVIFIENSIKKVEEILSN